jgi:DNA-directed RNA polymerase specialized sigma24 family protein
MAVSIQTEIPMSRPAHGRLERVIAEHYESRKDDVLTMVRGRLAADRLYPDPLDLEAAYNAAWHALYEHSRKHGDEIANLTAWLATITFRRAIDDIRGARLKHRAPVAVDERDRRLAYEHDVDADISDRQRYHQWLMSVRLRLNAREQQAVSLCVLHGHSRRDASEIMGIEINRLDKIMVAANKKLGDLLEAINRGDWCEDQRSLIKAYALGLHEEGGERHALAVAHVTECQACAAYVRSLRGLAIAMPAPVVLSGAAAAGGGILAGLSGLFGGGTSSGAAAGGVGAAAGGGGSATLLSGLGAKTAALCASAVCAAGGAAVVIEKASAPGPPGDHPSAHDPPRRAAAAPTARTVSQIRPAVSSQAQRHTPDRVSATREARGTPPDPSGSGAQQIAELGIEPQATSSAPTTQSRATSVPRAPSASEFGIGP